MSCAADIRGWRSPHLKSVYFWLERVHEIISRVGLFLKITPCSLLEEFILALHGCLFAGRHWSLPKDVNYKFSRARFKTRKCRWATLLQQQFSVSVFCFGGLTETCSIWTASREKKKLICERCRICTSCPANTALDGEEKGGVLLYIEYF